MAAAAATLGAFVAWVLFRDRRRRRRPGRAAIVSPRNSTTVAPDGSVHSVQSAHLQLPRAELDRLWTPPQLENLGRTYWRFLTRATLGIVRVVYSDDERSVVLLGKPLTLLRFDPPQYQIEANRGSVSWAIRDGLLVSRSGRGCGFLSVRVSRDGGVSEPAKLDIDVEVANFYPAIASRLGTTVYGATQSFVHVLVTHAFLRSLATLELEESKVGRLRHWR
ncbi:MAG TPA: hypothetical protein VHU61_04925 [Solirubrobacteraceae bacterium]|jgi:hypothetical protein|nr:hypothetical protein [Solirubrobacteraceae bacterium]